MSFIVLRGHASQWRSELTGYCPMAASWQRQGENKGGREGSKTGAVLAALLSTLMKALKKNSLAFTSCLPICL